MKLIILVHYHLIIRSLTLIIVWSYYNAPLFVWAPSELFHRTCSEPESAHIQYSHLHPRQLTGGRATLRLHLTGESLAAPAPQLSSVPCLWHVPALPSLLSRGFSILQDLAPRQKMIRPALKVTPAHCQVVENHQVRGDLLLFSHPDH